MKKRMKKVLVINSKFDCPFQPYYGECELGKYFGIDFECEYRKPDDGKDFPKRIVFDDPNMCPHHGGGMCRKTNPGRFSCYNEFPDECRLENYTMDTVKVLHAERTIDRETCKHRYHRVFNNDEVNGDDYIDYFCAIGRGGYCKEGGYCPLGDVE